MPFGIFHGAIDREAPPPPALQHCRNQAPPPPLNPAALQGRVSNVMDFGCFVELLGFRTKAEGLVHLSNISATKKGGSAKDLVSRGESGDGLVI